MPTATISDQTIEPEPNTLLIEDKSLRHGFIQLPKLILYARNLSRDAKLLYAILLGYAWQERRCFPGYHRLCDDIQASENMVRKYMRELEAMGLLRQKRRGLGKTNIYTLLDLRTSRIEVLEQQQISVLEPSKSEVKKETDVNINNQIPDDVFTGTLLKKFGISGTQAQRLASKHSPALIMEKLDVAQYLLSVNSHLIARNPQGWLIRAIEENYPKPKLYKYKVDRDEEEEQRRLDEEEIMRAQEARQMAIAAFKENRVEKPIPRTKLSTKAAWAQALEILQKDVNRLNFETWLKSTVMISFQKDEVLIGTSSDFVAEVLRDRMRSRVANALSNVVGRRVEVEFEAVPEMTRGDGDERGTEIVDE